MNKKIMSKIFNLIYFFGGIFLRGYLKNKHNNKVPQSYINERVHEYAFALKHLATLESKLVLDVGTGQNAFAAVLEHIGFNVIASDKCGEYWGRFFNHHIYVEKDDITKSAFSDNMFDAVNCISTLEHIEKYDLAVEGMSKILKPNGVMILSFPYTCNKFYDNIYKLPEADEMSKQFRYIARSFSDKNILEWTNKNNLKIVDAVYVKGWTGKTWRSGERINNPYIVSSKEDANVICLAIKKVEK